MGNIKYTYHFDLTATQNAFPYQQEAFEAVKDLNYSAIFHEQGLGKTKIAIDLLINDKEKTKNDRASSILLLSDGRDNILNDFQLGQELKNLTKGKGLNFTLNTFGYGYDHDPNIMKKLASIRDGSFFLLINLIKLLNFSVLL